MRTFILLLLIAIFNSSGAQQFSLVKDIWAGDGEGIGMFHKAVVYNNKIYFTANDGQNGEEYWVSDGTAEGTYMLKDIHAGSPNAVPDYTQYNRYPGLKEFDGYLYFPARSDDNGEELWRTDGSEANTIECGDIHPGFESSTPAYFHTYKDMLFFTAYHPEYQREPHILRHNNGQPEINVLGDLYSTNSTLTTMWNTFNNEAGNKVVTFLDTLIFSWYSTTVGLESWITNGTPAETSVLFDHYSSPASMNGMPDNYSVLQDSILCFSAYTPEGFGLWKMTRSSEFENELEIQLLKLINSVTNADFRNFHVHDDKLFFVADDYEHGREIWVSDGTTEGTQMLKDINIGSNHSDPSNLVSFNGHVYFNVYDSNLDQYGHIWRTDGTEAGTVKCSDIWSSNIIRSFNSTKWYEYNGKLYLPAYNPSFGNHYLASLDQTETGPQWITSEGGSIAFLMPGGFNRFIELNDELYFSATEIANDVGTELYKLSDIGTINIVNSDPAKRSMIFPNPAQENITISINSNSGETNLYAYDLSGKLVETRRLNGGNNRLNISHWANGIYTLHLIGNDESEYFKVVKK